MSDSTKKLQEQVDQLRRELERSTKIMKVSASGSELVRFVTCTDDPFIPGKASNAENPWVVPKPNDKCC